MLLLAPVPQQNAQTDDETHEGTQFDACGCVAHRPGTCDSAGKGYTCNPQPTCKAESYLSGAGPTRKGTCAKCTAVCPKGEYRTGSCGGVTDYSCVAQPVCTTGEFLERSGPTTKGACMACDNADCGPPADQYQDLGTRTEHPAVLSSHSSTSQSPCFASQPIQLHGALRRLFTDHGGGVTYRGYIWWYGVVWPGKRLVEGPA